MTRCPACRTAFRVTPEQLKARAGKVRCGYCSTVFDALETLTGVPQGLGVETGADVRPAAAAVAVGLEVAPQTADTDAAGVDPLASSTQPESRSDPEPAPVSEAQGVGAALGEDDAVPARAVGRRHRHRIIWGLGALIALALLVGQSVFVFRSELVVLDPELRPMLEEMCAALECGIPLPRKGELIGIAASDLHPDQKRKSLLVLAATLKNRAPFAQAYPHLELTLTDRDDRPLLRRVLAPQDYLARADEASSGLAANAEFPVKLWLDATGVAATGYRLYLFYP